MYIDTYKIGSEIIESQNSQKNFKVSVMKKETRRHIQYVTMRIKFDNSECKADRRLREESRDLTRYLPIDTMTFLEMFPFHIAFDKSLEIISAGETVKFIMPSLIGTKIDHEFNLLRPFIKFSAEGVKLFFGIEFLSLFH